MLENTYCLKKKERKKRKEASTIQVPVLENNFLCLKISLLIKSYCLRCCYRTPSDQTELCIQHSYILSHCA